MTALLAQHGTQRHARGTGKTRLWGKPRAPLFQGAGTLALQSKRHLGLGPLPKGSRGAWGGRESPSPARLPKEASGGLAAGRGQQLSEAKRGVNPLSGGRVGAEPSPPRSGLQRDIKVTNGPRMPSQLHTSILEAAAALIPPPTGFNSRHQGLEGQKDFP